MEVPFILLFLSLFIAGLAWRTFLRGKPSSPARTTTGWVLIAVALFLPIIGPLAALLTFFWNPTQNKQGVQDAGLEQVSEPTTVPTGVAQTAGQPEPQLSPLHTQESINLRNTQDVSQQQLAALVAEVQRRAALRRPGLFEEWFESSKEEFEKAEDPREFLTQGMAMVYLGEAGFDILDRKKLLGTIELELRVALTPGVGDGVMNAWADKCDNLAVSRRANAKRRNQSNKEESLGSLTAKLWNINNILERNGGREPYWEAERERVKALMLAKQISQQK